MHYQHTAILAEVERRRSRLSLSLLRVYNLYGVLLALILLWVFHQSLIETRLGSLAPQLFQSVTFAYGIVHLVLLWLPKHLHLQLHRHQQFALGILLWDIIALTVLLHASGGVASGLGTLMLVTVATAAILITHRSAALIPAAATIAVLYEEFYLSLSAPALHDDYFQAGVLGTLYFTTAISIRLLSGRIREKDIHSLTQASELADLEQLNRQIIQRMRTGILVVGANDEVRMLNQAARTLLGLQADQPLQALPESIHGCLRDWRNDSELRPRPFQPTPEGAEVRASFSPIRPRETAGDIIIFLEDTAELQQQALQLKLAALGQLSASIAHEIRNPLSAASHAAQLLRESPALGASDQRLTEIILNHCQRMNGVIENVLTSSRRQPPNPVRFRLVDLLEQVAQAFRDSTPDAELEIKVDPREIEVRMDRSQLDQVLTNLLGNAVRHSREHSGRPWARMEAGIDPRTERPYLDVIDRGKGVDPTLRERLFEPFFTTAPGGTGLGLYLSRELCEANQARLTHRIPAAGGACFRIAFAHPDRVIA